MMMDQEQRQKQDHIAQWAFDSRPILERFHLWLEDVDVDWLRGEPVKEFTRDMSFVGGRIERQMALTAAVTALGTRLFGRYGEGKDKPKAELNQVKKDADAISAYAMSESLWFLSRLLPENHAIMVCLGEGLMPKAGETPEMGSNPQLGFGRIYARPQVARWLDRRVATLLNDADYLWEDFYREINEAGITVWGAAIDTLENTSRFAKGAETGSMTVLHLFDQPLLIAQPYEGYMGNLILPREVVEMAAERSLLIDFRTPRDRVLEIILATYPGLRRENVHVWTLRGPSRAVRLGSLWETWQALGVHLVDDDWVMPSGMNAFTDSGTYAPVYVTGTWEDDAGETHLLICDGYAASAEAMQAASLAPMMDLDASLAVFTSKFDLNYERERLVMHLDPEASDFSEQLSAVTGEPLSVSQVVTYREMIRFARDAQVPLDRPVIGADDFFPRKDWRVLAVCGYMSPDPYSGAAGVEQLSDRVYLVTVRVASEVGDRLITFRLRFKMDEQESRLVFNPLLVRFFYGEDYRDRPVKISDSGRIRNELQTLCTEALEFRGDSIRIHFDRIPDNVISPEHQAVLLDVLTWYKQAHPFWFSWLMLALPEEA